MVAATRAAAAATSLSRASVPNSETDPLFFSLQGASLSFRSILRDRSSACVPSRVLKIRVSIASASVVAARSVCAAAVPGSTSSEDAPDTSPVASLRVTWRSAETKVSNTPPADARSARASPSSRRAAKPHPNEDVRASSRSSALPRFGASSSASARTSRRAPPRARRPREQQPRRRVRVPRERQQGRARRRGGVVRALLGDGGAAAGARVARTRAAARASGKRPPRPPSPRRAHEPHRQSGPRRRARTRTPRRRGRPRRPSRPRPRHARPRSPPEASPRLPWKTRDPDIYNRDSHPPRRETRVRFGNRPAFQASPPPAPRRAGDRSRSRFVFFPRAATRECLPRRREACLFPPRRWRVLPCGLPVPVFRSGSRAAFPRRVPTEPERPPPASRRRDRADDATSSGGHSVIENGPIVSSKRPRRSPVFHSGDERYVLGRRGFSEPGARRRARRRPARRTPRTPRTRRIRRVRRVRRVFHACRLARGDSSYGNTRRARPATRARVGDATFETNASNRSSESFAFAVAFASRSNRRGEASPAARSFISSSASASAAEASRRSSAPPNHAHSRRAARRAPPRRRSAKIDPSALRRKARSVRASVGDRDEKRVRVRFPIRSRALRRRASVAAAGGGSTTNTPAARPCAVAVTSARAAPPSTSRTTSPSPTSPPPSRRRPAGGGGGAGIGTVPSATPSSDGTPRQTPTALLAFRVSPFFNRGGVVRPVLWARYRNGPRAMIE